MRKGLILLCVAIILVTGCSRGNVSSKNTVNDVNIDLKDYYIKVNPEDYDIKFTIVESCLAEKGYTNGIGVIKAKAKITESQKEVFKNALVKSGYFDDLSSDETNVEKFTIMFKSCYEENGEEQAITTGEAIFSFSNDSVEYCYFSPFGSIPNKDN